MKYIVSFSVTDTYPTLEIEAKDRNEAIKRYQEKWEQAKLSTEGMTVTKDTRWSIQSLWKHTNQSKK
jgi:hypothetical protein